jgi:hypothetical protein
MLPARAGGRFGRNARRSGIMIQTNFRPHPPSGDAPDTGAAKATISSAEMELATRLRGVRRRMVTFLPNLPEGDEFGAVRNVLKRRHPSGTGVTQ